MFVRWQEGKGRGGIALVLLGNLTLQNVTLLGNHATMGVEWCCVCEVQGGEGNGRGGRWCC